MLYTTGVQNLNAALHKVTALCKAAKVAEDCAFLITCDGHGQHVIGAQELKSLIYGVLEEWNVLIAVTDTAKDDLPALTLTLIGLAFNASVYTKEELEPKETYEHPENWGSDTPNTGLSPELIKEIEELL